MLCYCMSDTEGCWLQYYLKENHKIITLMYLKYPEKSYSTCKWIQNFMDTECNSTECNGAKCKGAECNGYRM